jgi:hypothetical protein
MTSEPPPPNQEFEVPFFRLSSNSISSSKTKMTKKKTSYNFFSTGINDQYCKLQSITQNHDDKSPTKNILLCLL